MTLFTLLLINVAIPLLAASIGGFVGFWGARRLQDREQKERQLAAGRALRVEVHSNYKGAQSLADELYKRPPEDWFKDFTPGHYYSRNVWRDTLHLVSPLLRWSELETLDTSYRSFDIAIEEVERLRQQMRAAPQPPS